MKRFRMAILVAMVTAFTILPGFGSPAHARHTCGLEDPTLNAICESHPNTDYKDLLRFLYCLWSPHC